VRTFSRVSGLLGKKHVLVENMHVYLLRNGLLYNTQKIASCQLYNILVKSSSMC